MALPSTPDEDGPVLRVRFETDALLGAAEVGNVLLALGSSFERYARRGVPGNQLRLAVRNVAVGSLVADLVVVGIATAVGVAQHPEALFGFVGFLDNVLSIAKRMKPGKNRAADNRLVETLLRPVADGAAKQVNIFVLGDNNTVTFDREAVSLVSDAKRRAHELAAAGHGSATEGDEDADAEFAALAPPRQLKLRGKEGTVLVVKGQWYVRLEGEGGVLNPLELGHGVEVRDDQSYSFDGDWEGRSYRIRAARPVGS